MNACSVGPRLTEAVMCMHSVRRAWFTKQGLFSESTYRYLLSSFKNSNSLGELWRERERGGGE